MHSTLLLPHRFQFIGWLIFIPVLVIGIVVRTQDYSFDWLTITLPDWLMTAEFKRFNTNELNLTFTLIILGLIGSMGLIAFSKEAIEDEMIARLRLEALQWSLLINYILLVVATLLIYGFSYTDVLVFNMFTPLLVFILRFRWLLYRNGDLLAL